MKNFAALFARAHLGLMVSSVPRVQNRCCLKSVSIMHTAHGGQGRSHCWLSPLRHPADRILLLTRPRTPPDPSMLLRLHTHAAHLQNGTSVRVNG